MDISSKNDVESLKKSKKDEAKDNEPRVDIKTLPFPQRFIRHNLDKQFSKFLDYLKEITITVPFMDAIRDMPAWASF